MDKNETKRGQEKSPIKWRFLTKPSRLPSNIKKLQDIDKGLLTLDNGLHYIESSNSNNLEYDNLLSSLYSLVDGYKTLDSNNNTANHKWDLYSKWIIETYYRRSVKCYIGITNKQLTESVVILSNLLYGIVEKYNTIHNIKYRRTPLMEACKWLSKHLFKCYRNKGNGLRYSRDKSLYVKTKREDKEHERLVPNRDVVVRLIDLLCDLGYGFTLKGFKNKNFNKSMMSLFLPTTKLFSLMVDKQEVIEDDFNERVLVLLKDLNKEVMDTKEYKDMWLSDIKRSEDILRRHRELMDKTKVTIEDCELDDVYLSRIHCEGDIEKGGRLFDDGTWTTMKKEYREKVCFDGEPLTTIDLKYLHPALLYRKKCVDISNFDPYPEVDIPLDTKMVKRFMKFYGKTSYNPIRNVVKLALLIIINSKDELTAIRALNRKIARDFAKGGTVYEDEMKFIGLPRRCAKEVITAVMEHNHQIKEFFCTGISTTLMREDSDIMLETLDILTKKGVASLPLHDSISVKSSSESCAIEALHSAFIYVLGDDMNFKYEIEKA
ncbi:conserved hypothetical protein [Vibrio phage 277E43-1]|nr:conserved hypothetical protein [Vibrio phage 277E43-1]